MSFLGNTQFTKRSYMINAYPTLWTDPKSGKVYDSTKIWLLCPHNNTNGTKGLNYEEIVYGTSEKYKELEGIDYIKGGPVAVEVVVEESISGKGEKERKVQVCHQLKLISNVVQEAKK